MAHAHICTTNQSISQSVTIKFLGITTDARTPRERRTNSSKSHFSFQSNAVTVELTCQWRSGIFKALKAPHKVRISRKALESKTN